jgi:hypothetical protein
MNSFLHTFAFPGEMIPIIAIVSTFSVPVIAILVHHQRKMAELIHRQHPASVAPSPEVEMLRREVAELKQLVQQQTIAMDDVRALALRSAGSSQEVPSRLS